MSGEIHFFIFLTDTKFKENMDVEEYLESKVFNSDICRYEPPAYTTILDICTELSMSDISCKNNNQRP